jgi:hypothetical protein
MSNKAAIFAGALGGVAPNLVRLFVNYSSPSPQHIINQPVVYSFAMVGFAVLGALVVWAFQETNLKQALFLGIGLPSLFQIGSLQSAAPLTPPAMAPGTHASISLISSAYAQPPPPSPSAPAVNRTLNLTADKNIPYTVAFYGKDNALISSSPVTNPGAVAVPPAAVKFALQVGASTSNSYELPTSVAVIKADVKIDEKPTSGFIQGLGLAKAPQYDISVRVQ